MGYRAKKNRRAGGAERGTGVRKKGRDLPSLSFSPPLWARFLSSPYTVKHRYYGHLWDQKQCLYYSVSLLKGLILRKMYGAGPRKLSIVTSVRIKRGFTVLHLGACSKAHSTDGKDSLWDCVVVAGTGTTYMVLLRDVGLGSHQKEFTYIHVTVANTNVQRRVTILLRAKNMEEILSRLVH